MQVIWTPSGGSAVNLHEYGDIFIDAIESHMFPPNLPQTETKNFKIRVEFHEADYADNYSAIEVLRESFRTQLDGTLTIKSDNEWDPVGKTYSSTGETLVDAENAVILEHTFPEENQWGSRIMVLPIVFQTVKDLPNTAVHFQATFLKTGGSAAVNLGKIYNFSEQLQTNRMSELRPIRQTTVVQVQMSGELFGSPTSTPDVRRAALIALKDSIQAEVNATEGTLTYGKSGTSVFNKSVKVNSFTAEIDQAWNGIRWTLSAYYYLYPNENGAEFADYAAAELKVGLAREYDTGSEVLSLSGKITCFDEAKGLAKLEAIRTAALTANGYLESKRISAKTDRNYSVADDAATGSDAGTNILDITFEESYKMQSSADVVTFTPSGGTAISFQYVRAYKDELRTSRYSEFRNLRERSTGTLNLSGEYGVDPGTALATRKTTLQNMAAALKTADAKDGTLVYGDLFNKTVKLDALSVEINPSWTTLVWSLTASYTNFPNEDTYAAADFQVAVTSDKESGEESMVLNGTIRAATQVIALAKLSAVRTAALSAQSYTSSKLINSTTNYLSVNADDGTGFLELTFTETYRKRANTTTTYSLTVTDNDDTKSGIIQRSYSGSVSAYGATASAAYTTALAKAEELGSGKYPCLVGSRITATYRESGGGQEMVRLDFNYEYQVKGDRLYLEYSSELAEEGFGDSSRRISGFVTAADLTTARAAYASIVRDGAVASAVIRSESVSESKQVFTSADNVMEIRLDFSLTVYAQKASGYLAIKYVLNVEFDYIALRKVTTVSGKMVADRTALLAAEAKTEGNKLDLFLSSLSLGTITQESRSSAHELQGSTNEILEMNFSATMSDVLTTAAQVLSCEVSEEIQYSGTRRIFQATPDGASIPQAMGIEPGRRTVTGSVVAATETAAKAWVDKMYALPFPGTTPATRYLDAPVITTSWVFLPLTDGQARGTGTNFAAVTKQFRFTETLLNYQFATG